MAGTRSAVFRMEPIHYGPTSVQSYDSSCSDQKPEETKICRVCSSSSDGMHFGVEACRACAAFFRRSISLSKTYTCRDVGSGVCKIYKGTRMCRKCRLDKCMRLGMISEQVQNRPAEKEDVPEVSPSTSESCHEFTPLSFKLEEVAPLLTHINSRYKHFSDVQRSVEYSVVASEHRDAFNSVVLKTKKPIANFTYMCRFARAILPCVIEFVKASFVEFDRLSADEMWHVYRAFAPALWMFQSGIHTYREIEPGAPYIMLTQTTVIDINNARAFYENSAVEHNIDTLANMLRECTVRDLHVVDQIRDLKPTEIEMAAIVACLLWDQNAAVEKPNLIPISSINRDKIFRELSAYYRYILNIPDYGLRFGKLMCIYSSLQNNAMHFKEELELYNIMNLFASDTFIYDFIKR